MTSISELQKQLIKFRNKRNWKKYHTPKNLSMAITKEATELMEIYLWKDCGMGPYEKIEDEVADIFIFLLYFCEATQIDLIECTQKKIKKNEGRTWREIN